MLLPTRISSCFTIITAALVLTPVIALAQAPLQLNIPYRCEDGVTRTITRCEKNARAEVCFWKEEQNGQLNERYNVRGQMDGWLRTCTPQPASTSPAAPPPAVNAAQPSQPRVDEQRRGNPPL